MTLNDANTDDEAFRKQLRQMLDSDADGATSSSSPPVWRNGSGGHDADATPSSVDLNDTSPTESPFQAPAVSASHSLDSSSPSPYIPTAEHSKSSPTSQSTAAGGSKLEQVKAQVKEFSLDTFRTTKQLFSEIMGKGTRTVDPKVDVAIAELRTLQTTYMKLLEEVSNLHSYFSNVIHSQKQMTNMFGELAQRDPKLAEDFNVNAETQRVLIRNGEQLLGAFNFFLSNMRTLCTKTIQDCLDTAKKYESSRLQYDTYRSEHEQVIHTGSSGSAKSHEIRQKYEEKKKKYDQLKSDITIKMQFLEENKCKVVHRQMLLFHNAIAAYFSGNQKQLDEILTQFSIKLRTPNSEPQSWLEK